MEPDTWNEWGKHVLAEIQRLSNEIAALRRDFNQLQTKFVAAEVKLAMIGGVAGMVMAGAISMVLK